MDPIDPPTPPRKRPPGPGRGNKIRQGNGAGSGNWASMPAQGAGIPPTAETMFSPTRQPAPYDRTAKAERVAAHVARLEAIADEAHAKERYSEAIAATNAALDRLDGKPVQKTVMSGDPESPMQTNISVNFRRPEPQV